MASRIINTLGLVLNIVGVFIVFKFGFPQPTHDDSSALLLESSGTGPEAEQVRKTKAFYTRMSIVGGILMAAGFLLQLVATWM